MKKKVAIIIALSVAALLAGAYVGSNVDSKSKTINSVLAKESDTQKAVEGLVTGCAAKASTRQDLAMLVALTGGQACLQVVGQELQDTLEGKGTCSADDKKCLFTVGYTLTTLRAFQQVPKSEEEVAKLQSEIDLAFEKINSTKAE